MLEAWEDGEQHALVVRLDELAELGAVHQLAVVPVAQRKPVRRPSECAVGGALCARYVQAVGDLVDVLRRRQRPHQPNFDQRLRGRLQAQQHVGLGERENARG